MGLVVAVLADDTFEEPPMLIWGDTEDEVFAAVKVYLSVAQPLRSDGLRLGLDDLMAAGTLAEVQDLLQDVEDVSLTWYSSVPDHGDGWLRRAATVGAWIEANHRGLHAAHSHTRPVEDVVVHQDHL